MSFNGKKKILRLLTLLSFFVDQSILANGYESYIPGSEDFSKIENQKVEGRKDINSFLPGLNKNILEGKKISKKKYNHFSGNQEELVKAASWKENLKSFNNDLPFTHENDSNLIEFKKADLYNRIHDKGEKTFGFIYVLDQYEFNGPDDIFQRTYEDSPKNRKGGSLHFLFDEYLFKKYINFLYSINAGAGYHSGLGQFATSGEYSRNSRFILWTLPLDLALMAEVNLGRLVKVQLGGGASLMGLWQTRSDKDQGEKGKKQRQVSYGYMGNAKVKISLGRLFRNTLFDMFTSYDVTNYYLNLEARYQNYENFQDPLSISGLSFGAGFSFDYY